MICGIDGNAFRVGRARASFWPVALLFILGITLAPAFAAAPPARGAPKGNPRLASMQIEIWPEFDRPAAALVILKGEIAAGVRLPAAVNLRIPARSGGPTAVAYSDELSSDLMKLNYERNDSADYIALKFNAPGRFFHLEFYDPLTAGTPRRNYTYVWDGDLATEQLRVVLQEPAGANDVSVQPTLYDTAVDPDGLRYRSAELGAFRAGKRLEVQVSYSKNNPQITTAMLKPGVPAASPQTIAGPSKTELGIRLVAVVAVLVAGALALSTWWSRRKTAAEALAGGAAFCTQCGSSLRAVDRFCSGCGVALI